VVFCIARDYSNFGFVWRGSGNPGRRNQGCSITGKQGLQCGKRDTGPLVGRRPAHGRPDTSISQPFTSFSIGLRSDAMNARVFADQPDRLAYWNVWPCLSRDC
jgi:hypothetical protein